MQLDYIRLLVDNFDKCFRFYRDVMGFSVTWGQEGENYASFNVGDGCALSMFNRRMMADLMNTVDLPSRADAQDPFVLIFGVNKLDSIVEQLKKRGAVFIIESADNPRWGIRTAYLRDPDNNLIEINSPMQIEEWDDELKDELDRYRK